MASVFLLLSYLLIQIGTAAQKPISSSFSVSDARKYLSKYGYLDPIASPRSLSLNDHGNDLTNAIKKFQQFTRLPVTEQLDAATKAKMMKPRCGVPDFRFKRSISDGPIWTKKDLTWTLYRFTNQLSMEEQRKTMEKAFGVWSEVVPLTFKEDNDNDADFRLRFENLTECDSGIGPAYTKVDNTTCTPWASYLGHGFLPEIGGVHFGADVCWHTNEQSSDADASLLSTAIHEIGHALGLQHSGVEGSIMVGDPGDQVSLGGDDVKRIQKLYGVKERQSQGVSTDETHHVTTTTFVDQDTFQSLATDGVSTVPKI